METVLTDPNPIPMRSVSRFESDLIRILRCVLGRFPLQQALTLLFREQARPRCLSRACVELVQDALSKGLPLLLARSGRSRSRWLRNGEVTEGRLWERSPVEERGLSFSEASLEWLIWATAVNPADTRSKPQIAVDRLTLGDRLLLFAFVDRLYDTPAGLPLLTLPGIARHGLVWLAFPDRFAEAAPRTKPDFGTWFEPQHAWVLEALQPRLVERWLTMETVKRQMTQWKTLRQVGRTQSDVLAKFLDMAETTGRCDLARFLIEAARKLLRSAGPDGRWFRALGVGELRMADRTEVYEAGLAFLSCLGRLRQWERDARNVGFHDEEYAASQLWKSDWERYNGDAICGQAQAVMERFTPFQLAGPSEQPPAGSQSEGAN